MKKIVLLIALLFPFCPYAGKIKADQLDSKILGTSVTYNVYIPSGFEKSDKSYPVIYLLHGLWDDYKSWDKKGNMKFVADELMTSGECVEAVIIMPNAGGEKTDNPWYGYFNMPEWKYEDFFFQEFLPEVESRYHCGGSKGQRAIMGLSMGGGGSTVYCQRHPEMFSSCYAMSPWLTETPDNFKPGKEGPRVTQTRQSVMEHSAIEFLEKADKETFAKINTLKWMVDCGDDDFLLDQAVSFHFLMKKAGINSEFRVRNGRHNWEYWHIALRQALPFASRNFAK